MKEKDSEIIGLFKKTLGIILVIVGVILLPFPVLNGTICIIAGVYLISPEHGKRLIKKITEVFRKITKWIKK